MAISKITSNSIEAGGVDTADIADGAVTQAKLAPGAGTQWTTTGSDIYYNTGNVGIGTSSPAAKLDFGVTSLGTNVINVRKNGNSVSAIGTDTNGFIRIAGPGDAGINFSTISASDGTTFTERMRIDSSGNVGVAVTPWTGVSNALNYKTGAMRYVAAGNMQGASWVNTGITLVANSEFVYARVVAIGSENNRNSGYREFTILWNQYDGWWVANTLSNNQGNNYGLVDIQMSGANLQVKAANNASGGLYRIFLTYYLA